MLAYYNRHGYKYYCQINYFWSIAFEPILQAHDFCVFHLPP